jgi:hypothetical protein
MSNYVELAKINVNDKVEKKQKFSYLSWAWAVDTLMRADPTANWEYREPVTFPDGTMMVFCTVTAFGVARTMQLPVINHSNKPITNPNAFDINTSMQRCLVKAIALHGLGLYLYAGEDLPPDEGKPEEPPAPPEPPVASPELLKAANDAANGGLETYEPFWKSLTPQDRAAIGQQRHADFKLVAQEVKKAA